MKLKLFTFLFISVILCSCQGQTAKTVSTVDVKTYAEKLHTTEKSQLIDVRTPEEYASGKINDAVNINWNGKDFVAQVDKLDKSQPVFVYCKMGGRSSQAANKLAELGFKEIYNLDGGFEAWKISQN
jgi:rhodanese-related sulfurtransferase